MSESRAAAVEQSSGGGDRATTAAVEKVGWQWSEMSGEGCAAVPVSPTPRKARTSGTTRERCAKAVSCAVVLAATRERCMKAVGCAAVLTATRERCVKAVGCATVLADAAPSGNEGGTPLRG